jgi:hypothetical protein
MRVVATHVNRWTDTVVDDVFVGRRDARVAGVA